MKKKLILAVMLLGIIAVAIIYYMDIFGFQNQNEGTIAKIINYEDTRRLSDNLVELCKDPDMEIRRQAALAIGRIGKPDYVDNLFSMLNDDSLRVAEAAAFAIGLCGGSKDAMRLLTTCQDKDPDLEAAATLAAGMIADTSTSDLNYEIALGLDHLDHRVRYETIFALFRAGFKEAWTKMTEIARNDPVRPVQIAALFALVRLQIEEPMELYEEWYSDADPYVRSLAYRGLALGKNEKYITTIASGLNDRDNNVVSQAISSLASYNNKKTAGYLKKRYAGETDDKLKIQILQSFTRMADSGLINYAHQDIRDEEVSNGIKAEAINYLAKVRGDHVLALIDSLAATDDFYLRSRLCDALGIIGGENTKPRLVTFFKDSVASVRVSAFDALTTNDSGNVDYYINNALADDDYVVNAYAIYKIGELGKASYVPQLMTMIESLEKPSGRDAKYDRDEVMRSIVETAGLLIKENPSSNIEEILYRCLHDKDYITSQKASDIYEEIMDEDKSAYISFPEQNFSIREMKNALVKYRENPIAIIETEKGPIEIELYFDVAPMTVLSLIKLAKRGYFENLIFHRVVPNFVIQGGDPRRDGWGGPGYALRCEYNDLTFERGTVGMAHAGRDTGGSQFFITLSPQPHLDTRYTIFGRVTEGIDIVDQIYRGDKIKNIMIFDRKR